MNAGPNSLGLEARWRNMAENAGSGGKELDVTLPLPVIVGCTPDARPYIMILTGEKPQPPAGMEAVDVHVGSRRSPIGENWSLTFILKDWSLLPAFAEICVAFMDRIRASGSKNGALREVYSTVDQWRRLVSAVRTVDRIGVLRGVCGELLAATKVVELSGHALKTVLRSWTGPYGAPQDYSFTADHRYWEIKTIRVATKRIVISSPEQLNATNGQIGLITIALDETTDDKPGTVSLSRITERLRRLSDDPWLVGRLIDEGLGELGIDPYSDMAMTTLFIPGAIRVYDVRDGFPRVVPAMLPDGITNLTYAVELDSIEPFAVPKTDGAATETEE